MPDHMHILIGFGTTISIADLMRDTKAISSKFINEKNWIKGRFEWQPGYGVFSYSRSQIDKVVKYINLQQEHHKKKSFKNEYLDILRKADIESLKAFVSRPTDSIRPPFGKTPINYPRNSIFIGTINPTSIGYLNDETGNRRYWPVLCTDINMVTLKPTEYSI